MGLGISELIGCKSLSTSLALPTFLNNNNNNNGTIHRDRGILPRYYKPGRPNPGTRNSDMIPKSHCTTINHAETKPREVTEVPGQAPHITAEYSACTQQGQVAGSPGYLYLQKPKFYALIQDHICRTRKRVERLKMQYKNYDGRTFAMVK